MVRPTRLHSRARADDRVHRPAISPRGRRDRRDRIPRKRTGSARAIHADHRRVLPSTPTAGSRQAWLPAVAVFLLREAFIAKLAARWHHKALFVGPVLRPVRAIQTPVPGIAVGPSAVRGEDWLASRHSRAPYRVCRRTTTHRRGGEVRQVGGATIVNGQFGLRRVLNPTQLASPRLRGLNSNLTSMRGVIDPARQRWSRPYARRGHGAPVPAPSVAPRTGAAGAGGGDRGTECDRRYRLDLAVRERTGSLSAWR